MKPILSEYLSLQKRYASAMTREARRQRSRLLGEWASRQCSLPDSEELVRFFQDNPGLRHPYPFVKKVVLPCLLKEYRGGTPVLFSFFCASFEDRFSVDALSCFCREENTDFARLSGVLTEREPENAGFIAFRFQSLGNALWYSVHELPEGVIDVAPEGMRPEQMVTAWESAGNKLGRDVRREADAFRSVFRSWENYIRNKRSGFTGNFEAWLRQNGVSREHWAETFFTAGN